MGDTLDSVVSNEKGIAEELAEARALADEVRDDLPPGSGLEQAKAIAEKLKQRIEATRGDRSHRAQKIQEEFDDLEG